MAIKLLYIQKKITEYSQRFFGGLDRLVEEMNSEQMTVAKHLNTFGSLLIKIKGLQ